MVFLEKNKNKNRGSQIKNSLYLNSTDMFFKKGCGGEVDVVKNVYFTSIFCLCVGGGSVLNLRKNSK